MAHRDYVQKFRDPLVRRNEFPALLTFSSTSDLLHVTALQADPAQIGASTPPPQVLGPRDLAVQAHESFANNLAAAFLAGITLTDEQMKAKIIQLRGFLPDRMKNDEDQEPWSITFASLRPNLG